MSSIEIAMGRNPRQSRGLRGWYNSSPGRHGFTLIEMLIAMAITLVMIGAVVTLFANITNSVRNRRAVVEMSGQLRHARNMLQQDLQGATCNGLVWQRPDENQGYIEIIEGPRREGQASVLVDGTTDNTPGPTYNPEIDHKTSIIPASNLPFTDDPNHRDWLTDGGSLGDFDDILMLTVRNEHEPFVGRVPKTDGSATAVRQLNNTTANSFADWEPTTLTSPLAEVVWYAVENPEEEANANGFFGEPGMRTIYRRALLIAPWLNPFRTTASDGTVSDTFNFDGGNFTAQPGLLRILLNNIENDTNGQQKAIASLIAYQEKYDISAHLEWDPLMGSDGRWKIVANTLGDLTKRENRYQHIGCGYDNTLSPAQYSRVYPFPMVSVGTGHSGASVQMENDPELVAPTTSAIVKADVSNGGVISYQVTTAGAGYQVPPFLYFDNNLRYQATARAMLNDEGEVVRVIHGPVPLSRERRGEDVMLTDALGFDLRVYDPGAPLFAHRETETVLEPTDPAWTTAYTHGDNMTGGVSKIGNSNGASSPTFPFVGQGAYVDLGYGYDARLTNPSLPIPQFAPAFSTATIPWFFAARALSDVYGNQLARGYSVFDTWSFHYENDGLNEDNDTDASGNPLIDEGTNGLDDPGQYANPIPPPLTVTDTRLGPDDVGERETVPPYDKPLRGVQVLLRLYERDSRQVRQVSVNQSFVPE